jgi:epoxyqueuosine reductase
MNQLPTVSSSQIKQKAYSVGFHQVGITVPGASQEELQRLHSWLALGYQADMVWMGNPRRQDIKLVMPEVKSLVSVALTITRRISIKKVLSMAKFPDMHGEGTITKLCTKN